MGRDQDAIIYYHDHQLGMIEDLAPLGWIENTPRVKIGMPHLFPQWRAHIDGEVAKERANLREKVSPPMRNFMPFFPESRAATTIFVALVRSNGFSFSKCPLWQGSTEQPCACAATPFDRRRGLCAEGFCRVW